MCVVQKVAREIQAMLVHAQMNVKIIKVRIQLEDGVCTSLFVVPGKKNAGSTGNFQYL